MFVNTKIHRITHTTRNPPLSCHSAVHLFLVLRLSFHVLPLVCFCFCQFISFQSFIHSLPHRYHHTITPPIHSFSVSRFLLSSSLASRSESILFHHFGSGERIDFVTFSHSFHSLCYSVQIFRLSQHSLTRRNHFLICCCVACLLVSGGCVSY